MQKAAPKARIGVIGAGRIVEHVHLPLLSRMEGASVVGLFDTDPNRLRALSHYAEPIRLCHTLDELFNLDLDLTLIACPNHLHGPMTIAALDAGAHVVCEKPMASNSVEAERMVRKAESAGRELVVGFANRFRPEVCALRQAVENGTLGEIRAIRSGWLRRKGVPGMGTWFTNRAFSGGGALIDLGSHLLDLSIWLSGRRRLVKVECDLDPLRKTEEQASWYLPSASMADSLVDVEVSVSGFMVFEGPFNLFVEASWDCGVPYDQTYLHVIGERGVARLSTLFGLSHNGHRPEYPLQMWSDCRPVVTQAVTTTDLLQPYRDMWKYVIENISNGHSLRSSMYDALSVVQTIDELYRAAGEAKQCNEVRGGE